MASQNYNTRKKRNAKNARGGNDKNKCKGEGFFMAHKRACEYKNRFDSWNYLFRVSRHNSSLEATNLQTIAKKLHQKCDKEERGEGTKIMTLNRIKK